MKKYRSEQKCLNCGSHVEAKFCPQCGQENIETREPFLGFLIHSIGHYFHFDSKFQKSFVPLITQPGKLTTEYIAGKRASYIHPVSMYLFISLVFFLTIGLHQSDVDPLKTISNPKIIQSQLDSLRKIDTAKLSRRERAELRQKVTDLKELNKGLSDVKNGFNSGSGNLKLNLGDTDSTYVSIRDYEQKQAKLPAAKRDSWLSAYFIKKSILLEQKYGDELLNKIVETVQHQLPKMMFILMPLFALILSFSFYKSKLYFIEHLIYTIHVHSFLFLLFCFIDLLGMSWKAAGDIGVGIGMLISLWYIYRSMRRVYQKGRAHTLAKFLLLSFIYFVLLIISFIGILLFSVATL